MTYALYEDTLGTQYNFSHPLPSFKSTLVPYNFNQNFYFPGFNHLWFLVDNFQIFMWIIALCKNGVTKKFTSKFK